MSEWLMVPLFSPDWTQCGNNTTVLNVSVGIYAEFMFSGTIGRYLNLHNVHIKNKINQNKKTVCVSGY